MKKLIIITAFLAGTVQAQEVQIQTSNLGASCPVGSGTKTFGEIFPDKNLAQAVADMMDITVEHSVNADNLKYLSRSPLNFDGKGITNLTGLECLSAAKELTLSRNNFSTIDQLEGMTNLTYLNMGNNNILSFSPLKYLVNLQYLNVTKTVLSSRGLKEFETLTDLRSLDISYNHIDKISVLENFKKLEMLKADHAGIVDIAPITWLTGLTHLDISGNKIQDLKALEELASLTALDISINPITSLSPLRSLKNLTTLYMGATQTTNLNALENLTNLETLSVLDNNITHISPLADLTNLTNLRLSHNNITDIDVLKNFDKMTYLYAGTNKIADISSLKNMVNLKKLDLHDNAITSIEAVRSLTGLEGHINLSGNQITNVEPLAALEKITNVDLDRNNILDLSSLKIRNIAAEDQVIVLPVAKNVLTPTVIHIENAADITGDSTPITFTFNTEGKYQDGELRWVLSGNNSLTFKSDGAGRTFSGKISQKVLAEVTPS
ncbi:leucine-rich repeat domain-containing protein [Glaciimonas immobilis]|uniref:Leucine-rich repeat (LRR) protein n=1 Tax=Glaciimonas immobilis TaxID=728004 RepID=A0A840S0U7_9BURK|nr:leucine-rich repeat domain-containing protein [Glaciimonas immobilis]KAF3997216.1 leucine-rich repeat domain-containing protein [Glaciimonas immobilis]MBB5202260.1 Leucine-rich repeat (LRR) protein [Glaciimonas immobilis]